MRIQNLSLVIKFHNDDKWKQFIKDANVESVDYGILLKNGIWALARNFFICRRHVVYCYIYDSRYSNFIEVIKIFLAFTRAEHKKIIDSRGRETEIRWYYFFIVGGHLVLEIVGELCIACWHIWRLKCPIVLEKHSIRKIAYLRTDFLGGVFAGGSIAHTEGVVNAFQDFGYDITVYTPQIFSGIYERIPQFIIGTSRFFRNFPSLFFVYHSIFFFKYARPKARDSDAFYQRYSLGNFTGALLKQYFKKPLILEYNGSEVWISKNWGRGLLFASLFEKIELINLQWADVVVVISRVIRDELIARGIDAKKVLYYPNGVDIKKFNPNINGQRVRQKYNLNNKIVLGFIGTFGQWHGAEMLARAVKPVTRMFKNVHFLLVGDGLTRLRTEEIIKQDGVSEYVTFTGLIPQEQAPEYLAACDILLSPHEPNPDGTKFFGSPTKLFEYMAMGKPIIASNLDQIGEILENGRTAILCEPGDLDDFVKKIIYALERPEMWQNLGQSARNTVTDKYTWQKNVEAVMDFYEHKNLR